MQKSIDVIEYLDEIIGNIDETLLSTSTAFDDDEPTESINNDLNSLKEALKEHDKIFLAMGDFGYDDYYEDEPSFIFGEDDVLETSEFADEYYDKYKFSVAGYGIYLDKDLNIEYGYFTIAPPPSGHGPGDTTFHDFKDAKDDDIIKAKIYYELRGYDNGETDYTPSIDLNKYDPKNNPFNLKLQELTIPIFWFVQDKSFNNNEKNIILDAIIEYAQRLKGLCIEENSTVSNEIVGECPNCGNEISKGTKNMVAIKCSQCGHTFWF